MSRKISLKISIIFHIESNIFSIDNFSLNSVFMQIYL